VLFRIPIENPPSPAVNPETQYGFKYLGRTTLILSTGTILGNTAKTLGDIPLDAYKASIVLKPVSLRCCF